MSLHEKWITCICDMRLGMKSEIACKCGWKVSLHVIACREWDALCHGMKSGITCNYSWSVIAYERNGCNVPWHVMANMEWNDALACDDGRWSEVKRAQVLGKELATSSKWRKTRNKQANKKTNTKERRTFKHVNKQDTSKCKLEFGIWEKTKSMKMRLFIIFKEKMHFSWHLYQQVCNIKLKHASK